MTRASGKATYVEHRIELPDGRSVAFAELGDPMAVRPLCAKGLPESRVAGTRGGYPALP